MKPWAPSDLDHRACVCTQVGLVPAENKSGSNLVPFWETCECSLWPPWYDAHVHTYTPSRRPTAFICFMGYGHSSRSSWAISMLCLYLWTPLPSLVFHHIRPQVAKGWTLLHKFGKNKPMRCFIFMHKRKGWQNNDPYERDMRFTTRKGRIEIANFSPTKPGSDARHK